MSSGNSMYPPLPPGVSIPTGNPISGSMPFNPSKKQPITGPPSGPASDVGASSGGIRRRKISTRKSRKSRKSRRSRKSRKSKKRI